MRTTHTTLMVAMVLTAFCFSGCATQSSYEPVVVTTATTDKEKFQNDLAQCIEYLESVEADSRLTEVVAGGAVGAGIGTVGAAAAMGAAGGTVSAAVGAMLASAIFIPVAIITGAMFAKNKVDNAEEALRAQVLNQCLEDRGYTIFEEAIDLN